MQVSISQNYVICLLNFVIDQNNNELAFKAWSFSINARCHCQLTQNNFCFSLAMKSVVLSEFVCNPSCMLILFFWVISFSSACQGKNLDSKNITSLSGSLPFHKLRVESGAKSTVIGTDTIIPIEMKESYRVVSSFHLIVDTISVGISNSFLLIILDYLHNLALAKENA